MAVTQTQSAGDPLGGRSPSIPFLRRLLDDRFSEEDLRTVCADLDIDYDDLGGRGQGANARELVTLLRRRGRLGELVQWLADNRPDALEALRQAPPPRLAEYLTDRDFVGLAQLALARYWPAFLALTVVGIGLYLAYDRLRDRYLLSFWVWTGIGLSFALAAGAWTAAWRAPTSVSRRRFVVVGALATLLAVGGLSQQVWAMTHPMPFPTTGFHILIGSFGRASDHRLTADSDAIQTQLDEALRGALTRAGLSDHVQVRWRGVIRNRDEAQSDGRAVGAEVVLWGWLTGERDDTLEAHFEVIETPDTLGASLFPRLLPALERGLQPKVRLSGQTGPEELAEQLATTVAFTIGLAQYLDRDFQAALSSFHQALESLPPTAQPADRALVTYWLGRGFQQRGLHRDAVDYLKQSAQLNPADPLANLALAFSYQTESPTIGETPDRLKALTVEQAEAARDKLLALLRTDDRNLRARYDLGITYEVLEQDDLALAQYDRVLRADPAFYIAYINAARLYAKYGQTDTAIGLVQHALDIGSKSPWTYLELGELLWKVGRVDDARSALETAVRGAPTQYWMYYRLAQFYAAQGEHSKALATFRTMIDRAPDKGWAYQELGQYQAGQGDRAGAAASYLEGLRFSPESGWLHKLLADTLWAQGDLRGAIREYQQAIRFEPNAWTIRGDYGRLLQTQGDLDGAIREYEMVFKQASDLVDQRLNLAQAYEARGKPGDREAARAQCQLVLDRTTNDALRASAQECLARLN